MRSRFRHDLSDSAVVGHTQRLGDNGGPLVALWVLDEAAGVKVGLRVRTMEQANELVRAAQAAQMALAEEIGDYLAAERRHGADRRSEGRLGNGGRRGEDKV